MKKFKDNNLVGYKKYQMLLEHINPKTLLEELAQALDDRILEENMDFIAKNNDFVFSEEESTLLEELASYLNNYFEKDNLTIGVEIEDGEKVLYCNNYLSKREQQSLEDVSITWLQDRLSSDQLLRVYISKDDNGFYLTLGE